MAIITHIAVARSGPFPACDCTLQISWKFNQTEVSYRIAPWNTDTKICKVKGLTFQASYFDKKEDKVR